jgi:hypothetical protein
MDHINAYMGCQVCWPKSKARRTHDYNNINTFEAMENECVRDSRGGIERRGRRMGEHGSAAARGRRTGYGRRVLSFGK